MLRTTPSLLEPLTLRSRRCSTKRARCGCEQPLGRDDQGRAVRAVLCSPLLRATGEALAGSLYDPARRAAHERYLIGIWAMCIQCGLVRAGRSCAVTVVERGGVVSGDGGARTDSRKKWQCLIVHDTQWQPYAGILLMHRSSHVCKQSKRCDQETPHCIQA
jgi:hypothetical protein